MNEEETRRWRQLSRMTKAALWGLYRRLGNVWNANPANTWLKEDLISSILAIEFREQREKANAHFEELGESSYGGPHAVDTDKPYGYRVERCDGAKQWGVSVPDDVRDRATFTTAYLTRPEEQGDDRPRCSLDVAMRAATETRYSRSYYGPLFISVWAHRGEEEHYRLPVPPEAEWFVFNANPRLEKWRAEHPAKENQG